MPCAPAVQPVLAPAVQVSAATTASGRGSRPPAPVLQVLCFAGLQFKSICKKSCCIRGHFNALYKQGRGLGAQDTHLCGDRSQLQCPLPLGGLVGLRLSQRSRAARRCTRRPSLWGCVKHKFDRWLSASCSARPWASAGCVSAAEDPPNQPECWVHTRGHGPLPSCAQGVMLSSQPWASAGCISGAEDAPNQPECWVHTRGLGPLPGCAQGVMLSTQLLCKC